MAIADDLIAKEGGLVDNPLDKGGITKFGITKGTLSWYLKRPATDEDIKSLTVDVAKDIYNQRFVVGPGFDKLPEGVLQSNLVDFGVMSGPTIAILNLQQILHIEADGVLGPKTLLALSKANLSTVNNLLVKARCLMAVRICVKDPSQLAFIYGWQQRFFSFLA